MGRNRSGRKRFDQDRIRQFLADAQPRVADLANEIRIARQQPDRLLLSQPHFPQPVRHLRRGG